MNDLFHNTEDEQPLTVSEITGYIKETLEKNFNEIYVVGEISGYKRAFPSGHSYFNLKDEKASISCNLWSFRYNYLKFTPKDGKKVLIRGRITVYEPRGSYAIEVMSMTEFGIGELQLAFEKLKQKLIEEGLFDEKYKKPIPEFPDNVAIITSETGAVIEDFKKVTRKRYPLINLYLFPVLVQGAGSVESVCRAIRKANSCGIDFDVIVVARGGGSIEDLWTFNEEAVAREVFASKIPVVSAVGHEVDYTICDFVADLRAPTPSAAAEMILPDKNELLERLKNYEYTLKSEVNDRIDFYKDSLERIKSNYAFNKPRDILNDFKIRLDEMSEELGKAADDRIKYFSNELNYKERILSSISPEKTLKRGFAYVVRNGKVISRKKELTGGDEVEINFQDGRTNAEIRTK
ncbi:MAG: exodeoxyribonuclease VII large subunit [Bacteroidetes bacterium]|nr:exodeoxyribonuclease VII large subunit [Bacteroidota bacterium]